MRTKVRKSSKYGQVANIAVGYVILKKKAKKQKEIIKIVYLKININSFK